MVVIFVILYIFRGASIESQDPRLASLYRQRTIGKHANHMGFIFYVFAC